MRLQDAELAAAAGYSDAEIDALVNQAIDLPDDKPQAEPTLDSYHLIEIRCTHAAMAEIEPLLEGMAMVDGCTVDISG